MATIKLLKISPKVPIHTLVRHRNFLQYVYKKKKIKKIKWTNKGFNERWKYLRNFRSAGNVANYYETSGNSQNMNEELSRENLYGGLKMNKKKTTIMSNKMCTN